MGEEGESCAVMLLNSTGGVVTSPDFFGPQMALAYRLDANSQGLKKSLFPGPNHLPLALVMDDARTKSIRGARGRINHRCINSYFIEIYVCLGLY